MVEIAKSSIRKKSVNPKWIGNLYRSLGFKNEHCDFDGGDSKRFNRKLPDCRRNAAGMEVTVYIRMIRNVSIMTQTALTSYISKFYLKTESIS